MNVIPIVILCLFILILTLPFLMFSIASSSMFCLLIVILTLPCAGLWAVKIPNSSRILLSVNYLVICGIIFFMTLSDLRSFHDEISMYDLTRELRGALLNADSKELKNVLREWRESEGGIGDLCQSLKAINIADKN